MSVISSGNFSEENDRRYHRHTNRDGAMVRTQSSEPMGWHHKPLPPDWKRDLLSMLLEYGLIYHKMEGKVIIRLKSGGIQDVETLPRKNFK